MARTEVSENQANEMTLGQRLAALRQKKGLEIEKVAHDTRLRAHRIRELEADDYSRCPHPSYARMFLKDYAKYLGLSLADIKDQLPESGESGGGGYQYIEELSGETVTPPATRRLRPRRRLLPAMILLVAFLFTATVALNAVIWFRKLDSLGLGKPAEVPEAVVPAEEPPSEAKPATLIADDLAMLNQSVSRLSEGEAFAPVPTSLATPAPLPEDPSAFVVGGTVNADGRIQ